MRFQMALAGLASALVAACESSAPCTPDFPCLGPGGAGGGGGGGTPDARTQTDAAIPIGMKALSGRVCLITDLGQPFTCAATGVAGTKVTVGESSTMAADDGSFMIVVPETAPGEIVATRDGLMGCVTPFFGGSPDKVTVVALSTYREFLFRNAILHDESQGSILVAALRNGLPASGVAIKADPEAPYKTRYDNTALPWRDAADATTGTLGVGFVASFATGAVKLVVGTRVISQVPVSAGRMTIIAVEQ